MADPLNRRRPKYPRMKLTDDDVRLIRALREGPKPLFYREIAEKFDISVPTAQRVGSRESYTWVSE